MFFNTKLTAKYNVRIYIKFYQNRLFNECTKNFGIPELTILIILVRIIQKRFKTLFKFIILILYVYFFFIFLQNKGQLQS